MVLKFWKNFEPNKSSFLYEITLEEIEDSKYDSYILRSSTYKCV